MVVAVWEAQQTFIIMGKFHCSSLFFFSSTENDYLKGKSRKNACFHRQREDNSKSTDPTFTQLRLTEMEEGIKHKLSQPVAFFFSFLVPRASFG